MIRYDDLISDPVQWFDPMIRSYDPVREPTQVLSTPECGAGNENNNQNSIHHFY